MRIVLHIDMDAFFAAVEEREKPWLKGKPVVVGADPKEGSGRGVVSTANYKARAYGIRSAQPISLAWRLAEKAAKDGKPKAVFLGGNWSIYAETSERIMKILRRHSEFFEPASVDEAYLEIKAQKPGVKRDAWEYAERMAKEIKKEISSKEALTCSIGIGPNKLIAKIASNTRKPDGLTAVRSESVQAFLDPQPVGVIPGIGPKSRDFLGSKGVIKVFDLRNVSRRSLIEWFGKGGRGMYEKARGVDDSPVIEEREIKSIGGQETFEKDTLDPSFLVETLDGLCRSVFASVCAMRLACRTVSITVRFADFETKTRSQTLKQQIRDYRVFTASAIKLFLPFLDRRENPQDKAIRMLGVRAEHLSRQGELIFRNLF